MRHDILIDRVNHLYIENISLQYRLESLKKSVKFELINKQDVIQLQYHVADDIDALTQFMNNQFAELMMQIRELKELTASKASLLVDATTAKNIAKVAKKISEKSSKKAPLNIDFAPQSLVISHSSLIFSERNAPAFSIQNARKQLSHRWNDDFNDRIQRFHCDDYGLNHERSGSRLRSTSHESSAINSKSTYLQSISITIKQKKFKTSDIDYFYSDLSEETYAPDDYVISRKNIFYRDVYIFT